MKILVTGSTGLIGGRVALDLIQNGHEVFLGSRHWSQNPNWASLAQLVTIDFTNQDSLLKATQGIDAVIHLAGMNASDCAKNPEEAKIVNGDYTQNILKASIANKLSHFIYFSTAHVYKSPLVGKISESDTTSNPHPYATSHLLGEEHVLKAKSENKINGAVVRLSNSFGAPTHKEANCWMLIVNDLCKQAVEKNSIQLTTSGIQRRDFIALGEVSRATLHLLSMKESKTNDGLFNVGGHWSPSVLEMAELVASRYMLIAQKNITVTKKERMENEKDEPLEFDISKFQKTGFTLKGKESVLYEIDQLIRFCLKNFMEIV